DVGEASVLGEQPRRGLRVAAVEGLAVSPVRIEDLEPVLGREPQACAQDTPWARLATARSVSRNFCALPLALVGTSTSSRKRTWAGTLKRARRSEQNAMS